MDGGFIKPGTTPLPLLDVIELELGFELEPGFCFSKLLKSFSAFSRVVKL